MEAQSHTIDSTTRDWNKVSSSLHPDYSTHYDPNETPIVNSTNPNYHHISHTLEKTEANLDATIEKTKGELKKGQQQLEDIVTKTKRLLKQQWNQTSQSMNHFQKKFKEMVPKQVNQLIYWQNPIQSGIVFSVLLSIIITFMFLSSLAAISFWTLALLSFIGLYKLYNYVMATFLGRSHEDIFDSVFSSDINITERQAHALANYVRANGTTILRQARSLFLWNNITNSTLFGCFLIALFYIGLSMNALTFALVGLIFLFTVPKIYQVYQVPIDRTVQQIIDQCNQLIAKLSNKGPIKPKKN